MDFTQYEPQKVFLVQGDEGVFETILNEQVARNPLTQALSVPRLTIEHARTVAAFATEGTGEPRAYIISFSAFSPEAAQVLLKSLEEPDPETLLIFVTRYPYLVPQTVRSRLALIHSGRSHGDLPLQSILGQIKKEAAEKDDDAAMRRGRALELLDALEGAVRTDPVQAQFLYRAKQMLFFANLPTKYVLDYITTVVRA